MKQNVKMKKGLAILLVCAMLFTLIPISAFAAETSGTTGAVSWNYDTATKTLTISGNGAMGSNVPWSNYIGDIQKVIIGSGVTNIGSYAFYDCSRLESVTIPASVIKIGNYAFYNCSMLETVTYLGVSEPSGGSTVFFNTSLMMVRVPQGYMSNRFCGLNIFKDPNINAGGNTESHTCSASTTVTGKAATCTEDGWNTYYKCSGCDKLYEDADCTTLIPDLAAWKAGEGKIAAGHNYGTLILEDTGTHTPASLKDGMQAHYFCDTCDTYFDNNKNATTKEALTIKNVHAYNIVNGYKEDDGHANTCSCGAHDTVAGHTPNIPAATETEDQLCSVCGYMIAAKTGHICKSHLTRVPVNAASCTQDGNIEYYKCSCGKYYTDSTAAVEIIDKESVKIPSSHDYGTLVEEVPAKHTAAELKAGMKAHYFCDVCDTYFTEGKVETTLAALTGETPAHSYGAWINTDKTNHWKKCSCGLKAEEAAHVYDNSKDAICNVCNYTRTISSSASSGGGFSGSYNYPVKADKVDGADVTLSDEHATARETVTITVKLEAGKQVDEVIVTDKDGKVIPVTKAGDNQYSFIMPEDNVNVAVTTKNADYTLRIVKQINNHHILVNGKTVVSDVPPVIVGDRTLVPIRIVTELLGGSAHWDDATRTVTLHIDGKVLSMTIGKEIPGFDTSAVIMNDRTYVPIRYVAEKLGANVEWIAATQQIVIEK